MTALNLAAAPVAVAPADEADAAENPERLIALENLLTGLFAAAAVLCVSLVVVVTSL